MTDNDRLDCNASLPSIFLDLGRCPQSIARTMDIMSFYSGFQTRSDAVKDGLLRFLLDAKRDGKTVVGYGAAAKGNTLLNYAGVKYDVLPFICDAALAKQGKMMPGSHIPILAPEALSQATPDYILVLHWNIADEVKRQLADVAQKGAQFVTAVPEVTLL